MRDMTKRLYDSLLHGPRDSLGYSHIDDDCSRDNLMSIIDFNTIHSLEHDLLGSLRNSLMFDLETSIMFNIKAQSEQSVEETSQWSKSQAWLRTQA